MRHGRLTPGSVFENLLTKPGNDVACVPSGIILDEEHRSTLDRERSPPEPSHLPAEEPPQRSLGSNPGHSESGPQRQQPGPTLPSARRGQQATDLLEDDLPVRPTNHESEEIANLTVGESHTLLHVLAIRANLPLDDVAEAETTGHRLRRILVLQKLSRQILVPQHLKQPKCDHGLNPTGLCLLGGRSHRFRQGFG